MKFLFRKWLEKTVKAAGYATLAFLTSPVAQSWVATLGITIDPDKFLVGLMAVTLSLTNYLKHQAWTPKLLRSLL